jgi:Bax protein
MAEFVPTDNRAWDDLLRRVDAIPASLALAQSANESAWGTSRFAKDGSNFFGQWCYDAGCGLVPSKRNAGASHEVAVFDSPEESVASYLLNLNTNRAYTELRSIRASLRARNKEISGEALAAGLRKYSERGDAYVKELRSMIRYDDLGQYDR